MVLHVALTSDISTNIQVPAAGKSRARQASCRALKVFKLGFMPFFSEALGFCGFFNWLDKTSNFVATECRWVVCRQFWNESIHRGLLTLS